jgi:glycosyltransferase involved in cell wall biosynthesis
MKLGIITTFPPSELAYNEYAYHLSKNFASNNEVKELILFTDKTVKNKKLNFPFSEKVKIVECWKFNSLTNFMSIIKSINVVKPNQILFNLHQDFFSDRKIPELFSLLLLTYFRIVGYNTTVIFRNTFKSNSFKNSDTTSSMLTEFVCGFFKSIYMRLILNANTTVVNSFKFRNKLKNRYPKKNIVVIPHGSFEIPIKPNYKINKEVKKILTFGKFGTHKKVEILIEAVKRVRQRTGESIEIVVAGKNMPNTPNYLQKVREKYKNLKLLTFTGYIEEENISKLFKNSSVVVLPYTYNKGDFGVLHQAGAYSKPIILPNIHGLKELIEEKLFNGVYFELDDIESLAVAIQKFIVNDLYRIELGKINYQAAKRNPMSKICNQYITVFKKVV